MARANENVGGITRTPDTATTPGTGTTTIEGVLSVDGTTGEIYNSGSTFGVDADGNVDAVSVTTSGDVSTGIYTLNTVGADLDTVEQRTQKITYVQSADTTNISGKVIASGVTLNNGNINTNGTLVAREVANASGDTLSGVAGDVDDLTLSVSGVTKDVTELNHKTQNINTNGTYAGTTTFDGNVLADGTIGNGRFMATADGMVSGTNFTTTAGADLNAINQRTSGIEKTAADTKVEGVGFYNGRMDADAVVTDKLTVADELTVNGLSNLDGVRVQSGSIYATNASNVGGVQLAGGLVDGVDVSELGSNITGVTEDVTELNHKTQNINTKGTYAGTTTFDGNVLAGGTIGNGRFMATADGMVSGTNFTTTAGADLNAINQRTSGIEKTAADTKVEGVGFYNGRMDADAVVTDKLTVADELTVNGLSNLDGVRVQSGSIYATNASNVGGVQLAGGLVDGVDVSELGSNITGVTEDVTELNHKTQNINTKGTYAGTTTFDGNVLAGGTIGNGRFMATADGMVSGTNFTTTAGADLNAINQRTSGIEKTAADTKVEGVGFYNGRMDADAVVTDKLTVADELTVNGLSNLDGVRVQNGSVYATNASNVGGVQLADGNVTATEVTAGGYKLTDIGKNTQDIHYNDGVTTIGEDTLAVTDEGYVTINNGAFAVGPDGMVAVGNSIQFDGETGVVYANDLKAANNVYSKNYNLEEVGADLDDLTGSVGNIGDNVAGIRRDAAEGAAYGEGVTSIEGSTSFDANGMVVGDNAIVANTDGSFSAGNGSFKVSDGVTTIGGDTLAVTDEGYVTINNGAFAVGPDGMVAVGNSIQFDGETGVVYANDLKAANNVYSKNYNLEEVGADLDDLTGSVGNIGDNVAGITRDAEDGALPGEGTTTIEDTLSVSGDSVLAQVGSSQLVITEDVAGLSSGNASFALSNNELQLSVAGNGLLVNQFGTNLNGTVNFIGHDGNSYTLSDLEGRVYDLEQKTQNITSADPGQGGSSEVPPTGDGHTGFEGNVTVGGDINADAGNFNKVNTDEINVGDNTFIDGDSVNSNEGNFKDKVTVGSGENQTVINNGGITVGDSEGTSINHDEVRVGGEGGSYMNENDVVTGEGNSLNDTANRVGNLEQGVSELNNRVGELEDRIDKVGAMAAAIANLRTMGYDPAAPTEVAVGIGQYRDETGAALGLFHYPNRDFMLSLSVSTSGDEVMGGIGATWKFGRKSPEKVAEIKKAQAEADARRAEEAKLAKAEEMKQAAKEAKIKAQQERHAKLAAERAAQAEAAK